MTHSLESAKLAGLARQVAGVTLGGCGLVSSMKAQCSHPFPVVVVAAVDASPVVLALVAVRFFFFAAFFFSRRAVASAIWRSKAALEAALPLVSLLTREEASKAVSSSSVE